MALKPGKRDIAKVAKLLDEGDFESADDAASALMDLAWEIYEAKAKWTVVGQLWYRPRGVAADPEDAPKIALGRFTTEKQALDVAERLVFSTPTGETFRAWVLPVCHGTPNDYFQLRNKAGKAKAIEENGKAGEWDERARFFDQNPGRLVLPDIEKEENAA